MQRPWRALLTTLGTVLGIGAFVAILGLTTTANSQISKTFNKLSATEVDVSQSKSSGSAPNQEVHFPRDAELSLAQIHGAKHSGTRTQFRAGVQVSRFGPGETDVLSKTIHLEGISVGLWSVIDATLTSGRLFDSYLANHPVALLGSDMANEIGITTLQDQPTIYIDGSAFTLIGLIDETKRAQDIVDSVVIPYDVATKYFGAPEKPPTMLIETKLGAAPIVASQAPTALNPAHPEWFEATGPETPRKLANQVSSSLRTLFFALAAVSLLIGAVGIANTTLIAVLERVPEIGLRRSLGALPRHIGAQFLVESTILGAFGGLMGTLLGTGAVVIVAAFNDWTAVVEPWATFGAPLLGALVGLLAGLYPSLRAARVEPIEAFRR